MGGIVGMVVHDCIRTVNVRILTKLIILNVHLSPFTDKEVQTFIMDDYNYSYYLNKYQYRNQMGNEQCGA
jgi:hypothetical protein